MKHDIAVAHMKSAFNYAELSRSTRKKVGCVIVKDNKIISIGYNGTLPGEDNCCEGDDGLTHQGVIHAETNAIDKLAETTGGARASSVFVTAAPCVPCAVRLANINITELYYGEVYRGIVEGLLLLNRRAIPTHHIDLSNQIGLPQK